MQTIHVIRDGPLESSHTMIRNFSTPMVYCDANMRLDTASGLYVPI
ncbi:MAG: hypothetical protein HY831_02450 [Candidatus Aenigmarchaeota archaeon]|nr:hypothetical protein [Candidatus Aenigmarchaeota archaeon]